MSQEQDWEIVQENVDVPEQKAEEQSKPQEGNSVQLPLQQAEEFVEETIKEIEEASRIDWNNKEELHSLFARDSKVAEHVAALNANKDGYLAEFRQLVEKKVASTFSTAGKARILAALIIVKERKEAQELLRRDAEAPLVLGLGEVVRAVQLLDAPRKAKQMKKKLAQLEARKEKDEACVKARTIIKLRNTINNLSAEPHPGSFSGACQRMFRKWASTFTEEELEFSLLNFSPLPWKQFSDIVHPNPKDFALDYFLEAVFGKAPPSDSPLAYANDVTTDNLAGTLRKCPQLANYYSFLRIKLKDNSDAMQRKLEKIQQIVDMGFDTHSARVALTNTRWNVAHAAEWMLDNDDTIRNTKRAKKNENDFLDNASKMLLARHMPLQEVLWFWEELQCADAAAEVQLRLGKAEEIGGKLNYGKLMERMLTLRKLKASFADHLMPYAEQLLKNIQVPAEIRLDKLNLAVLGDASGSMEVAIQSASIIGSLLSAVLHSDLVFFNSRAFAPPVVPRSAADALRVVEKVRARGGTSMAAALWPYLQQHKSVDVFILVSDEGENERCQGMYFHEMFLKYRKEVNPLATVFLVSFLAVGDKGFIMTKMQSVDLECRQFRLDPRRPDTSKFESLLGHVMMELSFFSNRFGALEESVSRHVPEPLTDMIMKY